MTVFYKKGYGGFCQAAKKSGGNNEVSVLQGGRKVGFHCAQFPNGFRLNTFSLAACSCK